jgi:hypothetical protein
VIHRTQMTYTNKAGDVVDVEATFDPDKVPAQLAARALRSPFRKATACHGAVVVTILRTTAGKATS